MKRVPAARLFFLLVGAFFLCCPPSIWGGSPPKGTKKLPPCQARKSDSAKTAQKASKGQVRESSAAPKAPSGKANPKTAGKTKPSKSKSLPQGRKSEGSYHVVRKGQNLFGISRAYHVSVEDLVKANDLPKPSALRVGQRLFIPGAKRVQRVEPFKPLSGKQRMEIGKALDSQDTGEEAPAAYIQPFYVTRDPLKEGKGVPSDSEGARAGPESPGEGSVEQAHVAPPGISPERPTNTGPEGFIWPLINRITSRFGPRGRRIHTGVDIAAPSYHEVVAAADGEVIYVQHSRRGLGNAVVLQHENGYRTVYGHGVVILVQEGDTVKRGEPILGVGNSGHSTGNHLHFEIRKDGIPLNPIPLMPPTLDQLIDDLRADRSLEGPS